MSEQTLTQLSRQEAVRPHRRTGTSFSFGSLLVYGLLILLALVMLFPYYYLVVNAFKGTRGFAADPYSLIPKTFSLESIQYAWSTGQISVYLRNSAVYATIVVVVQTLICAMAAYAFARVQFPGRDVLFLGVLATMMLPYSVLLIPTYLIVWSLGLANTIAGVVVPGFASAYSIFMLRQFFLNIPLELEDAARIDGCSRLRIFFQIIVPLAQPALVTIAMFTFIGEWSSFIWPLVVLSSDKLYPITVGIALFRGEHSLYYDRVFAASLLATVPLLVVFFLGQRYIIGGISLTGLKG
ncbi:MAG TPA: carbohydrate ABC transporter permease [Caldilineaceae bacterium]|nr:carbohydrate ABC transporter permease [Caldilineaceae bacterium]